MKVSGNQPTQFGIRQYLRVAFAAPVPLQDAEGIRIHQHRKTVANAVWVGIDQHGALPFDASAQDAAQAEQRSAAANFAGLAAAIADDLAVGAQYCVHQGNRVQDRLPFSGFVHTKPKLG